MLKIIPKPSRTALPLLLIVAIIGVLGVSNSGFGSVAQTSPAGRCQLSAPAFCDTFDQPFNGGGGRTGQLDPSRWTIARIGNANPSQGMVNFWIGSDAMHCKTPVTGVMPDVDYFMCGIESGESEHFMEAFNDQGGYLYNDARIRQPFDFANRTGIITFDVDAKTFGSHSWWPEMWITDQPQPAPHLNIDVVPPRNGIGLEFSGGCNGASTGDPIPNNIGTGTGNLGLVDISRNYQVEPMLNFWSPGPQGEQFNIPWIDGKGYDCYQTMPDMKNHFEIHVSQNRIEVWASDPVMDPTMGMPLKLVATLDNLNLPFTRGYVHLEHAAYNAEKGGGTHAQTYHWDNVGFDGPVLPAPALYSVPDALDFGGSGVNVGYQLGFGGVQRGPLTFKNVSLNGVTAASLTWNPWGFNPQMQYRLNGGPWHVYTDVKPNQDQTYRSADVPVVLSELREGDNTVDFAAMPGDPGPMPYVSNIDLVMDGSSGTLPLPPATSTATATATQTPIVAVPSATPSPTATPSTTPIATPTALIHAEPTPTAESAATATSTTTATATAIPCHGAGHCRASL